MKNIGIYVTLGLMCILIGAHFMGLVVSSGGLLVFLGVVILALQLVKFIKN